MWEIFNPITGVYEATSNLYDYAFPSDDADPNDASDPQSPTSPYSASTSGGDVEDPVIAGAHGDPPGFVDRAKDAVNDELSTLRNGAAVGLFAFSAGNVIATAAVVAVAYATRKYWYPGVKAAVKGMF